MTSVVMAAHNEASVIGATLDALLTGCATELEVIVVPNGCTDATSEVARSREVLVLDLDTAGKAAALNAGDAVAATFPRIYLDADIIVPPGGVDAVVARLQSSGALVAVPGRRLVLTGRPRVVVAYFSINSRLPVFRRGLFGRGMIALSAEGRSRFETFPEIIADDLFLDALFTDSERTTVDEVEVLVETPRTVRGLIDTLSRVRQGNAALRSGTGTVLGTRVRPSHRWSWLTDVVVRHPSLAPAAVAYVGVTLLADVKAKRAGRAGLAWEGHRETR